MHGGWLKDPPTKPIQWTSSLHTRLMSYQVSRHIGLHYVLSNILRRRARLATSLLTTSLWTDWSLVPLNPRTRITILCSCSIRHLHRTFSSTMASYITKVHGISRTIATWWEHRQASRFSLLLFSIITWGRLKARLYPKVDGRRPTKWTFDDSSKDPCFSYQYSS